MHLHRLSHQTFPGGQTPLLQSVVVVGRGVVVTVAAVVVTPPPAVVVTPPPEVVLVGGGAQLASGRHWLGTSQVGLAAPPSAAVGRCTHIFCPHPQVATPGMPSAGQAPHSIG